MATPIGAINQRVTIQRPVETQDGTGQVVQTWQDVATVFAAVETTGSMERDRLRQLVGMATHAVTIWYLASVDAAGSKWRVKHGSRYYAIEGVVDAESSRRRQLVLSCTEVK
jgi:SPP1 family predicted phage head-tail adaptor